MEFSKFTQSLPGEGGSRAWALPLDLAGMATPPPQALMPAASSLPVRVSKALLFVAAQKPTLWLRIIKMFSRLLFCMRCECSWKGSYDFHKNTGREDQNKHTNKKQGVPREAKETTNRKKPNLACSLPAGCFLFRPTLSMFRDKDLGCSGSLGSSNVKAALSGDPEIKTSAGFPPAFPKR